MPASLSARLRLADRYADLGLDHAASAVLENARATADAAGAAEVLDALCRLYSEVGDGRAAREAAAELARVAPGPRSRLRLGEAQLAAGEWDAARFAFAAVLEAASADATLRASALLGSARVAVATDDEAGAGAAAMMAFDELVAAAKIGGDLGTLAPLFERAIELASGAGRSADLAAVVEETDADAVPTDFLGALVASADGAAAREIAAHLERECERRPDFLAARLRKIQLSLQHRHRDESARASAVDELEALAAELESGELVSTPSLVAAVQLSLAAAYDDEPEAIERALDAYRRGLELKPGQLTAATRLADLADDRGDRAAAIGHARTALTIDAENHLGWLAAARACGAPGPVDVVGLAGLLEAASPATAPAAPAVMRLLAAAIEVARADLLAGMHARGHRVKNLLGIVGSRARKARKLAQSEGNSEALGERLGELERELTSLFEEWSQYLRSMHADGPALETVYLVPLLRDVGVAAQARGIARVEVDCPARLPPLRADRVLLREALLNLASNAVDACEPVGGSVRIVARSRGSSGAVIEIVVADTGGGIRAADLARVLAPGFTTKQSGSGLGLAIAERVVRAHRGRLLIDSEEGRGTTITVLLPTDLPGVAHAHLSGAARS